MRTSTATPLFDGRDVFDALASAGAQGEALRAAHPALVQHVQEAAIALFGHGTSGFPRDERLAVAAFVAGLHRLPDVAEAYADAASDGTAARRALALSAGAAALEGPYGTFGAPELAAWSVPGPDWVVTASGEEALGARLARALEYAHFVTLHPRDTTPSRLARLEAAGWGPDDLVTLAQEIGFLAFQLRLVAGLRALVGSDADADAASNAGADAPVADPSWSELVAVTEPSAESFTFTLDVLDWTAWIPDVPEAELTDRQRAALVHKGRAKEAYFRLLARDPDVLEARTLADDQIFSRARDGLPRGERELAATATSRLNGCVYCASVHARFTAHFLKNEPDVLRLLDEGVDAPQDERTAAVIAASVALSRTPSAFGAAEIGRLRDVGLDAGEIYDLVHSAAFFGWANRLMLTLGAPHRP